MIRAPRSRNRVTCPSCATEFHLLPALDERRLTCTRCGSAVVIGGTSHAQLKGPRLHCTNPPRAGDSMPREAILARRAALVLSLVLTPVSAALTAGLGLPGIDPTESLLLHAGVPSLIAVVIAAASLGLSRGLMIGWFGLIYACGTCALLHVTRATEMLGVDPSRVGTGMALRYAFDHLLPLACCATTIVLLMRRQPRRRFGIALARPGESAGMPQAG